MSNDNSPLQSCSRSYKFYKKKILENVLAQLAILYEYERSRIDPDEFFGIGFHNLRECLEDLSMLFPKEMDYPTFQEFERRLMEETKDSKALQDRFRKKQ